MQERSLVTGSHGFLGERLVQKLEQQEHSVFRGDREGSCPKGVDYIFDLASYGNLYEQIDLEEIYRANVMRLLYLLENANEQDYKGFVVTSTNSVWLPKTSFYTASKVAAEALVKAWVEKFSKPIVIVRPFSVTGVGEQTSHLIPKLIRSCLYGEEMPFVDWPAHDFIDIDDVVNAFIVASQNAQNYSGQVFEAGTGKQYTNEYVKNIVEEITRKKANLKPVDKMRSYDTTLWLANNSSLKTLGWKQTKTLEQSIAEMVNYEKSHPRNQL